MSRPHKNPKTGVDYFRQKTPADLRAKFGRAEVGWSLHTKNEGEAIFRNAEAILKQANVRGGSVCLNSFRAFRKWFSAFVTPRLLGVEAN